MTPDDFSERRPRRDSQRGFHDKNDREKFPPREEELEEEVNPNAGLPFARKWRMAVFGGSFDPVHLGHIQLARQILEHDLADEVLFVPAKRSPFKSAQQMNTGAQRLEMLNLAVADALTEKPNFTFRDKDNREVTREYRMSISDMELQRPGANSYTYDTLTLLHRVYPDVDLKFLMGTDCLDELMNWHRAGDLIQQFDFIIYPRPGKYAMSDVEIIRTYRALSPKLVRARLSAKDFPVWDLSATDVRRSIARGGDLSDYLSPSVWKYIQENGLYTQKEE